MNEEFDIILSRYFCGEATPKELRTLDVWLSKSDENEKYFHQMSLLYQYTGQAEELSAIDTEKALSQFKSYMYENQKNSNKSFFKISRPLKAVAAIAILLIGIFSLFYFINSPSNTIRLVAVDAQKECVLFDNANVTLFPGTEIVYHTNAKHQIQLKGKASFNIHSKTSESIVIQANETYIEDIGTIFTVDATDPEKNITVEVSEGEVLFYTKTNSGVRIKANEKAVYNAITKEFKMIVEPEYAVLQQGIAFQNTSFCEAIDIVKHHFGIEIIVNSNELNDLFLNVSFDKNETVDYVLEIIAATISAEVSKKNGVYIISPLP